MKNLYLAIIICSFMTPLHAQVFKKLKGQIENKFKEKIEQKKNQKIDEKTDHAATKIMNTPDSVINKTGKFIKEKRHDKKDSLNVNEQQKTGTVNNQASRAVIISPGFSTYDTAQGILLARNVSIENFFYKMQQLRTGSFNRKTCVPLAWMKDIII